jgi:hypothetical protein
MRVRLGWVVGVPLALWAVDFAVIYLMCPLVGHSAADAAYWGSAVSWLVNAGWVAGVLGSLVAVLLVLPAVLVTRVVRKRIAVEDERAGLRQPPFDVEQRRWLDPRLPRV